MQYRPVTLSILALPLLTLLASSQTLTGTYNCPGVFYVDSHSASSCCVGATQASIYMSTCPGWPICTGQATTTQGRLPMSCATDIAYTDNNYEQLVSSASASVSASGVNYQTAVTDWQVANGGLASTAIASGAGGASGASTTAGAGSASNTAGASSASATSSSAAASSNEASVQTILTGLIASLLVLVGSSF